MASVLRIGEQSDILGESSIWHQQEQALYWVDIRRPVIRRLDHASGSVASWPMPDLVGSIAFCADGRLLVALPDKLAFFDRASGTLAPFASLPQTVPGHRCNDGRCDSEGRFWVGTMHNGTKAPEGLLYRVDRNGHFKEMASGIAIPNSLGWSPDGRTMYFSDSYKYAIFAYDFEPESGAISNKRVFAATQAPAFPDGSTVDADGFVWNAQYNGWRVVRYAPDGSIDRVIELPVERPTCCAFGGPNLETLYITTSQLTPASQPMSAEEMAGQPQAGALFTVETGVRGRVKPRFLTAVDMTT